MRLLNTAIAIVAMSVVASAADNSLGTWKRNVEKSKYNPPAPNPLKSLTMVREASGNDGVKVTNTGVREDGTPVTWSYTAKYDGKEVPVTGNAPFDRIAIKKVNDNTFTSVLRKTDGKYHMTGRTVISKDGKTSTLTSKGTNADGKPFTQTIVSEKQ
jgi:hypothetical protein